MLVGSDSGTVHPTPMSKSPESLVRIDAISIDLTGSMEKCDVPVKCTHFSIRGYVAEMRKKEVKTCFPFPVDCNRDKLNELANKILPPLDPPNFRWWRCQNCLQGIGAKGTAEETGLVADCCKRGYMISNLCVGSSTAVKKDVWQIGKSERSKAEVSASAKNNNLQNHIFLPSLTGQKKLAVESATTMVYGSSFNGAKSGSLIEFCEPSHRNRDSGDGRIPEFLQSRSPVTGNPNFGKNKQLCDPINHQALEIDGVTNEGSDIWTGKVTGIPPGVMAELDNSSSETNGVLKGTKKYGPNHDNSNVSTRQRARKVRLLTELLGSKENEEDGQRTRNASCRLVPDASVVTGSVPTTQHRVTSEGNPNKVLGYPKGKRKMPREKDQKTIELAEKVTKKVRVSKEDAESLTMSIENETTESVSEGDDSAGVSMQTTVKHLYTQNKSYRSPISSKKNTKLAQLDDSVSSLMSYKQVTDKCYQVKSRDAERYHVDSLIGFSKLSNDAPVGTGVEACSNRKPHVTKKKNRLQEAGAAQVFSVLERNCMPLDVLDARQGIKVLGNVPKPTKLQPNDLTMRRSLGISPEICATRKQQDGCFTAQRRDGENNLLPRPSREDQRGKSTLYIGESSVSSKSIAESRKRLLCELNEQSAQNTRFHLHEMQNSVAHADDGDLPQHLYLDFSGPREHEDTRKMQEQGNDDIPMEIVELLARNQYERRCHDAERNHVLTERMNHMRNSEQMYFPRSHINGGLESSQEDNHPPLMVKPPYGMDLVTMDQSMSRFVQQNANNSLYDQHTRSLLNARQMNGNTEFSVFGGSSKAKEKQSAGIKTADPRPVVKWNNDMSSLESYHQRHNSTWLNTKAPPPSSSSQIPNCVPFGYRIPQKYATTQSDDFDRKGKRTRNLDLNFSNLEPQIMDFHSQSFRDSSAIDLNQNATASLDLHVNETIPAMQLLSLMDARTRSSVNNLGLDNQKSNFPSRPIFPCDDLHPVPHEHLFPYARDLSVYGEYCPSGKFCSCSSSTGPINAILQNGGSRRGNNNYTGQTQVSFGSQECRKPPVAENRDHPRPVISVNHPIKAKLKGPAIHDSSNSISLEDHSTDAAILRMRNNYENRNFCSVNRNPADFTTPGPGNMYMISGKDLKIGKKRQRAPKTIHSKEQSHYHHM